MAFEVEEHGADDLRTRPTGSADGVADAHDALRQRAADELRLVVSRGGSRG
jgi:hypothetical protein